MLASVLVACGGGNQAESTTDASLGEPSASVELVMRDIAFAPTALEARAGEVLEIRLRNTGSLFHDFVIDEVDAAVAVTEPAGRVGRADTAVYVGLDGRKSTVVQVGAAIPGTYEFYCSVAGHRQAGMQGTLTVLP
ncbi:MAG: cupredoxin domain-containing protein [Chloroflexi bacterium]|nr:cupredoxin domain-containing protein [Chloroflexota bacterium]